MERTEITERKDNDMAAAFNLNEMLSTPTIGDAQIVQIPCDNLIPYHNHKFSLYDGERLEDMVESIRTNGVLIPIIVQPAGDKYEILIGHNRWNASKLAGKSAVPAIIKNDLTENEAEIYVVESNLIQRGFDNLKVSEQAAVISMRHSEMFSQGKRNDIKRELVLLEDPNADVDEQPTDTNKEIGEEYGMGRATIARLIRIDKLIPEIKPFVDEGTLSLRAGVELSYTDEESQINIAALLDEYKIDMKAAHQIRAYYEEYGTLTKNDIIVVLTKPKPNGKAKSVKIKAEYLDKYFKDTKSTQIAETIERALDYYFARSVQEEVDELDED